MTLTIRPARPADLEPAKQHLNHAGLPTKDLTLGHLAFVAERDGMIEGVIGRESFADTALLRSLVVDANARGAGVGSALVTALETACTCEGVTEMWLLTIDADAFFTTLGYTVRKRADAPAAIRTTEEFSKLCPDDAVLMSKCFKNP